MHYQIVGGTLLLLSFFLLVFCIVFLQLPQPDHIAILALAGVGVWLIGPGSVCLTL